MKHYLLSVLQPTGGTPPPPDEMAAIGARLQAFHEELSAAGYLGGICIVAAPDDASALEWARKAQAATTLPVEVRAFAGEH